MNRIDTLPEATGPDATRQAGAGKPTDMTRDELGLAVARAYRLRGEAIRTWTQSFLRTCASLWRRPGRAIPEGYRPI